MDIAKFQLINRTTTVDLPMFGAQPTDRFLVKAADGLGPTPIGLIAPDGVYQGIAPADRELVFRIGLNPDFSEDSPVSVGKLRSILYGLLNPQNGGLEVIAMDRPYWGSSSYNARAKTRGYARNFEINPFSETPEVLVTITCPGMPYWEHPFEILDDNNIISGGVMGLSNIGQVDVGFKVNLSPSTALSNFFMINEDSGEKIQINKAWGQFAPFTLDTREGQRYVRKTGASVLGYMSEDSVWLKVPAGGQTFSVPNTTITGDYWYTPLYWGL